MKSTHYEAESQPAIRKQVLRANAVYLGLASIGGLLLLDVPGAFFSRGPLSRIITAPYEAIGFLEAHGLALVMAVLLWRAAPLRSWHFTAAAVHMLLGTANLLFWPIFAASGTLPMGYITTSLHWIFAALQLIAATVPSKTVEVG